MDGKKRAVFFGQEKVGAPGDPEAQRADLQLSPELMSRERA